VFGRDLDRVVEPGAAFRFRAGVQDIGRAFGAEQSFQVGALFPAARNAVIGSGFGAADVPTAG
jgi:hypothetical protein